LQIAMAMWWFATSFPCPMIRPSFGRHFPYP